MRILIVAFANSIHTVRWVQLVSGPGREIHLFPSDALVLDPAMRQTTVHLVPVRPAGIDASVVLPDEVPVPVKRGVVGLLSRAIRKFGPGRLGRRLLRQLPYFRKRALAARADRLATLIGALRPDVVHSLEIQHAGYLTLEAKKRSAGSFPPWIVTNWGADIHHFAQYPEHASRIREVLGTCDGYTCETERDVRLGREFGFRGSIPPVMPNAGGFDLAKIRELRSPGPTSGRRWILLKGYHGWVYRGLVGLEALKLCANALTDYTVGIYLASPCTVRRARAIARQTGLRIQILPHCSHETMLRHHGRARLSIGLSLSDGISTSFLEALVMGSFPIQSDTSGAVEWIQSGVTGVIVPPEDPEAVAAAIRTAVSNDALVDRAAEANWQMATARLDVRRLQVKAVELYDRVLSATATPGT